MPSSKLRRKSRPRVELSHSHVPQTDGDGGGAGGGLNGAALARMHRLKLPSIKVVFLARSTNQQRTEGFGEFLPVPLDLYLLVDTVVRLLTGND